MLSGLSDINSCRRRNTMHSLLLTLSSVVRALLLVLLVLGEAGEGLEMETVKGGCLQVTLKPGDHIKTDPRCILSRGTGLALRPPALPKTSGIVNGLKRWSRRSNGRKEKPQEHPLQRLSNTMPSNQTDCLLTPLFPGDVALVSVSNGCSFGDSQSNRQSAASDQRRKPTTDTRRNRVSSPSVDRNQEGANGRRGRNRASPTETASDNSERPPRRNLVVLTQAIVAVGPEVIVKPFPSADRGGRARGSSSSRQRGTGTAAMGGALSVCEGQGPVAVAGYGKLKKIRLSPGQKRLVESSRAVGWTSGVVCLAGGGGRSSGSGSKNGSGGTASSAAVTTFLGPGTVYVQTHSLSGLRRLLLPRQGMGVSLPGGVSAGFLGVGGAGTGGPSSHTAARPGGAVGLSLKRGLAKRAKAGAKRVALGLAFFALYLVVYSLATALLLEGRDGLVKAPRHASQVVRSLIKVARRVALVLVRLVREELWRTGEGVAGDSVQPHQETARAR